MEQLTRDDTDDKLLEWLVDRLAEHITAGAKKADFLVDRAVLPAIVEEASWQYDNMRFSGIFPSTLHELKAPLARVIEILKRNHYRLFGVLAGKRGRAEKRYKAILDGLEDIARAVPPPPRKRGKGRPPKTGDLRALVECLVKHWEALTGHPLKQNWHKGSPLTPSTMFIHDVVEFIDHERLGELPGVTKKIVSERRKSHFR